MKNLKSKIILIILAVSLIGLLGGCGNQEQKPIKHNNQTNIVTQIDTLRNEQGKAPSYIDAKQYHIIFNGTSYAALYPGGTLIDYYDTPEEAQEEINRQAKNSRERWEKYGGY